MGPRRSQVSQQFSDENQHKQTSKITLLPQSTKISAHSSSLPNQLSARALWPYGKGNWAGIGAMALPTLIMSSMMRTLKPSQSPQGLRIRHRSCEESTVLSAQRKPQGSVTTRVRASNGNKNYSHILMFLRTEILRAERTPRPKSQGIFCRSDMEIYKLA